MGKGKLMMNRANKTGIASKVEERAKLARFVEDL